jgi:uncharacterized protein
MTTRTKAGWLFAAAMALVALPYIIVFGIGSVWMWQHGLLWCWAIGTGVPTLAGLALLEWSRRLMFPRSVSLPPPAPASTAAGQAAMQAVHEISQRLQAENPPLEQADVLEKVVTKVLLEVLDAVARQYRPDEQRPVLQVPVAHVVGVVELVARDFRQTFVENVPWGNTVTLGRMLWWKNKGQLGWQASAYLWQLNRIRRIVMRPATAIVQEVQDHLGQNMATKSVDGLKRWAIDYCVTKAGHYAIQLYSGQFVRDDEYRSRISERIETFAFEQEPLQVLVVGQVKSGKSSLINALLGRVQATVDTLPATESLNLYECQPEGLPPLILRDTPGYGAVGDRKDPFSRLAAEIEQCDLLLVVGSAHSAARRADRELLQRIHEWRQADLKRVTPPVVYVLTHIDLVPEHLAGEAVDAAAADLGVRVEQIVPVCSQWGELSSLSGVVAAIDEALPTAERLKASRCIRQIRREQDEDKILRQVLHGLRLTGGWVVGK